MQRPAIRGVEVLVAVAVGVGGGVYTVQPALEAMKQRHQAVIAAKGGVPSQPRQEAKAASTDATEREATR
ncbi:hypothetical protein ACSSS7_008302 [Eimeria intestinalis]